MRVPRLYVPVPLASGTGVELGPDAANHITRVLRLRPGAELCLFDGSGLEYGATLLACHKHGATAEVGAARQHDPESPLDVTLVQGISRGERMDYTLQKAVELGVTRIVPVFAERTVVQLGGDRAEARLRHWQAVVTSAAEQCGRTRVPPVSAPVSLDAWFAEAGPGLGLVLDPRADHTLPTLPRSERVVLLIGPEGGLSPAELAAAARAGYLGVRLGPRILRTETAAVAALAALQTIWGDLG